MNPSSIELLDKHPRHSIADIQTQIPVDINCDPSNPKVITIEDVKAAAKRIEGGVQKTPCVESQISRMYGMTIFFKKEFLQYTGSFKERGARNALLMLTEDQKKKGVVAASAGNHALALAYHGEKLKIAVTVVMPTIAPLMKIQRCISFGAKIIIEGKNLGQSRDYALKLAQENGLLYINGYDHPHIIGGQGTMGLEIMEQVNDVDAVIIPVGGAGLIAGSAVAIKSINPKVKIIAVESEKCPSFRNALEAGKPVYTETFSTLADGLAVPTVGVNAFATVKDLVDKTVIVKEESIALATLRLVEMDKAVVEGAGATGLAAIIEDSLPELKGKRVVIAASGGNIDTTSLGLVLERGLAADDRLVRFIVTVPDKAGGIAELTHIIAEQDASIKDIFHEAAWMKGDIFAAQVMVMCETKDKEHSDALRQALNEKYEHVTWSSDF